MQRSAVLTVLGVLNLLVALAGIVGDLRTLLAEVSQHVAAPPLPAVSRTVPTAGQQIVLLVLMVVGLAATIALAAGGIGLLKKKPWGRTLSLGYACYALLAAPLTHLSSSGERPRRTVGAISLSNPSGAAAKFHCSRRR